MYYLRNTRVLRSTKKASLLCTFSPPAYAVDCFLPACRPSMAALALRSLYCSPVAAHLSRTTPAASKRNTRLTTPTPPPSPSTPKKKVLVPVGFGSEEMEAVILVDILRRAGADVVLASVEPQLEIRASSGTKIVADDSISSCSNEIFDLVVLPGGMPGSARLRDCEVLRKIMNKQVEEKRLYGAICAAPAVVLQPWGLMRRKQMTGHPAFMHKLPTFWAVTSNLQISGELTTSRGPGTTFEFALSFVEQMFGSSLAEEIGGRLMMHADGRHPMKEEFNPVEWSVDHTPKVLVPIANGSEEMEIVMMVDILRRAKVDVVVASVEKSMQILASQGTKIVADKSIDVAAELIYDAIVLPGGIVGSERLHKSKVLKKLLKEQESAGRIYGGICSSPAVLHKQGLLKGKKATAHPSVINKITGEVPEGAGVVIDGKVITSRGLGTAMDFSLAIVKKLFDQARARSVAEGLVFDYSRS